MSDAGYYNNKKLVPKQIYNTFDLEFEFKDKIDVKKMFYRRCVKEISEFMIANGFVHFETELHPMRDSERTYISLKAKIFAVDTSRFNSDRIPL